MSQGSQSDKGEQQQNPRLQSVPVPKSLISNRPAIIW